MICRWQAWTMAAVGSMTGGGGWSIGIGWVLDVLDGTPVAEVARQYGGVAAVGAHVATACGVERPHGAFTPGGDPPAHRRPNRSRDPVPAAVWGHRGGPGGRPLTPSSK